MKFILRQQCNAMWIWRSECFALKHIIIKSIVRNSIMKGILRVDFIHFHLKLKVWKTHNQIGNVFWLLITKVIGFIRTLLIYSKPPNLHANKSSIISNKSTISSLSRPTPTLIITRCLQRYRPDLSINSVRNFICILLWLWFCLSDADTSIFRIGMVGVRGPHQICWDGVGCLNKLFRSLHHTNSAWVKVNLCILIIFLIKRIMCK